jgi:hypothetical protein
MSWFALHPALTGLLLVTALCLLSLALGLVVGKSIALADRIEQPEPLGTDTVVLDWADRPATWL